MKDVLFADSLFFEVFDFKVLSGNPKVALGEPGKVFLTKSMADKILKDKETTHFKIDKVELEVAGIIADPPPTSHINFTMVDVHVIVQRVNLLEVFRLIIGD